MTNVILWYQATVSIPTTVYVIVQKENGEKAESINDKAINDKLTFTPHTGNVIKKENQNLHELSKVKRCMISEVRLIKLCFSCWSQV